MRMARIGDFRKVWQTACTANGRSGRIVHDLRRSGVRHLIDVGNDPGHANPEGGAEDPQPRLRAADDGRDRRVKRAAAAAA